MREVKLTEEEFHQACAIINAIGQNSNAFHNEAVLMSGSLGVSTLVCLLNNGNNGATETTANLLGPFWRLDSPRTENGGSIVRSPTPGPELFVNAWVKDRDGKPVAGAEVDVWQSSTEGLLREPGPDPGRHEPARQVHHRRRTATSRSAASSRRAIRSRSTGRSAICCKAQGRHNMRPAHLHFLIYKPGYKTHISQVYLPDDPNIETDVQFGVTRRAARRLRAPRERERRRRPASRTRGTRSTTPSSWSRAPRSCRARRSRTRRRPPRCGRSICAAVNRAPAMAK